MTNPDRAPARRTMSRVIPAATILQTLVSQMDEVKEYGVVSAVTYIPNAAITGAASPASRTLTLVNKGQTGIGTTVIATLAYLSGINGVAFDEQAFTLSATAADLVVNVGDILVINSAPVGGTGLVDPGGTVQVELDRA